VIIAQAEKRSQHSSRFRKNVHTLTKHRITCYRYSWLRFIRTHWSRQILWNGIKRRNGLVCIISGYILLVVFVLFSAFLSEWSGYRDYLVSELNGFDSASVWYCCSSGMRVCDLYIWQQLHCNGWVGCCRPPDDFCLNNIVLDSDRVCNYCLIIQLLLWLRYKLFLGNILKTF